MATYNSINSNVQGNNTFLGSGSGNITLIGDFNIGLGSETLNSLTTGLENVGIGFNSLTAATTAQHNVCFGNVTGTSITTGSQNTIVGSGSGAFLTTGTYNTLLGYLVGSNYTTVETRNLIIGSGFSGTALDTDKFFLGFIDGISNVTFAHNFGTGNTFLGVNAGNLGLTVGSATFNTGMGLQSLSSITTGDQNTCIGTQSGFIITTGEFNTAIGYGSLQQLLTGSHNISIGESSGNAYLGAEGSNICLGHSGVIGESNVIHLGTNGNNPGQQNKCFIAGITGVTPAVAGAKVMIMDTAGQAGTLGAMTNGQLVIGSTGANPVLASLTAGANITITPGAGSISIAAAAGGGISFTSVSGAVPMTTNSGYYVTLANAGATFTLPATATAGDIMIIQLQGNGLFTTPNPLSIAQNAGQNIFTGAAVSTTGVTGGINSSGGTSYGGSIVLRCLINDTTWFIEAQQGISGLITF